MNNRPKEVTHEALRAMLEWLNKCEDLGWGSTAMGDLESMWWKYHNAKGEPFLNWGYFNEREKNPDADFPAWNDVPEFECPKCKKWLSQIIDGVCQFCGWADAKVIAVNPADPEQLPRIARAVEKVETDTRICVWFQEDSDGPFTTSCNNLFEFNEGGPVVNGFRWCPYCGLALEEELCNEASLT